MQLCGTFLTETLWLLCGAGAIYSCVERDLKTKRLCGAREEEEKEITLWLIVAFGLIFGLQVGYFRAQDSVSFWSFLSSFLNIIFISLFSFWNSCLFAFPGSRGVCFVHLESVRFQEQESRGTTWKCGTSQHVIYNAVCGSFEAFLDQAKQP